MVASFFVYNPIDQMGLIGVWLMIQVKPDISRKAGAG
jgi:hypothetical protein